MTVELHRLAKRVLLVGWDAADWQLIDKFVAEGKMPFMQQFLARGARGNIATLQPVLSPMLWNSIATGKRAYKHGIHGFTEPMPDGKGVRPSSSTTRKCKALWNILSQEGMTANVVSWFVSHPAEPINGVCVTEMFRQVPIDKKDPQSTVMPEPPDESIHPESLRDELAGLRLHPAELTEAEILPFIPDAAKIDQAKDYRLASFARLFSEMINTHNAATYVMQANDWDFTGVYYDAIDHFGHGFMEYHPPKMEHVSEQDFQIYQHVMEGVYRFHDMLLGRLMRLAGQDTTILLCSDHGYYSDHLRPKFTPREPSGPAVWHRDQGIIAMAGPGVLSGEPIVGATLLDIAPTVLNLLGLPAGRDMDGKTLTHVIGRPGWSPPEPIESWETVPGNAGMHSFDKAQDPYAAREALRQLVELGYIEQPDPDDEKAAKSVAREAKYNLARSYMEGGLFDKAATLYEQLFEAQPEQTRFGISLMRTYLRQHRHDAVRATAAKMLDAVERRSMEVVDHMDHLVKRFDEEPDQIIALANERWELTKRRMIQAEADLAKEQGREAEEIQFNDSPFGRDHLAKRRRELIANIKRMRDFDLRSGPMVNLILGRLESIQGNYDKALEHLAMAEKSAPRLPGLNLQLGQTYLRLRRHEDARRSYEKALSIDPDNALAHEGLATALLRLNRPDQALDHALSAVELMHNMPSAHLRLGVTLARLGQHEQSAHAFKTCLKLAPNTPAAHRFLAMLYRTRLGRPDLAQHHRRLQSQLIKDRRAQQLAAGGASAPSRSIPTHTYMRPTGLDPSVDPERVITIVSGLPRSGTSMMMQMLTAGGLKPLTDRKRQADDSNPRGYFEHKSAAQLATDPSWLAQARGKVVKIVAQLLPHLPDILDGRVAEYRVVFMDRDLEEVVASQRAMLDREGQKGADLTPDQLAEAYRNQLNAVYESLAKRKIPWLMVKHAAVIRSPQDVADQLNQAFGGRLDAQAIALAVDPELYRERKASKGQ